MIQSGRDSTTSELKVQKLVVVQIMLNSNQEKKVQEMQFYIVDNLKIKILKNHMNNDRRLLESIKGSEAILTTFPIIESLSILIKKFKVLMWKLSPIDPNRSSIQK